MRETPGIAPGSPIQIVSQIVGPEPRGSGLFFVDYIDKLGLLRYSLFGETTTTGG